MDLHVLYEPFTSVAYTLTYTYINHHLPVSWCALFLPDFTPPFVTYAPCAPFLWIVLWRL